MEYVLTSEEKPESFRGNIINLSSSGLCVHLHTPLKEGQKIVIKKGIPSFLCKTAIICWLQGLEGSACKAGLRFTSQNVLLP